MIRLFMRSVVIALVMSACTRPNTWIPELDAGGSSDGDIRDGSAASTLHIDAVTPLRGPHLGGNRVLIEGRGFVRSGTTVYVDDFEIPESGVVVNSSSRLSIIMPAHAPGPADIRVRVEDTEVKYEEPYIFDA